MADEGSSAVLDEKEAPSLETIQEELNRMTAKHELERKHRKNAESKISEFEKMAQDAHDAKAAEVEAARIEAAKKSGNIEDIEQSWREKNDATVSKYSEQIEALRGEISNLTKGSIAKDLAAKLFGDQSSVFLHHVESRLQTEIGSDGKSSLRVLSPDGKPSALTIEELHDEFYNSPNFSRFIVGSSASGGGANGANAKGGSAAQKTIKRAQFDSLDQAARHSLVKEGVKVTD